ncbi:uncharacterized protein LOC131878175 [Tigriopus californicus]|uniref:uncharacterized protein LOC131878175 n=1 Tax=Tigriopus californicus TaxID=6832 RepID=UPI0027DA61F9|nr:uncharacterized protein LOC131878175 [Tigriopus californicus]
MKKMPLMADLQRAVAYIGPKGQCIPLYSRYEVAQFANRHDEDANCHAIDVCLVRDTICPPYAMKTIQTKPANRNVENATLTAQRAQEAIDTDGIFIPHAQTKLDRKQANAFIAIVSTKKGTTEIPVLNTTERPDTVKAGTRLGPEPKYEHLDTEKDEATIRQMLWDFIGAPPEADKNEPQKRESIHKLFKNQIRQHPRLTATQKQMTEDLLYRFYHVLSQSKYDVGKTDLIEFQVDTGEAKPVKDLVRPQNPLMRADLRKTLDEWLNNGITSPSMSAWSSALVPVKKKDGLWRYAVDY